MRELASLTLSLLLCAACAGDRETLEALALARPASLRIQVGEVVTLEGVLDVDSKLGPVLVVDGGRVALEDYDQSWYSDFVRRVGERNRVTSALQFFCETGPHP